MGCIGLATPIHTAWAREYADAREQAVRAFSLAYEEAIASPLSELHARTLVDLARYLTVIDEEKARKALDLAAQAIATKPRDLYPSGVGKNQGESSTARYSREARGFIELAGIAALIDLNLSRRYLLQAREWSSDRVEADECLAAVAEIGLAALDGRERKALDEAVAFCSRTPTVALDEGKVASSRFVARLLPFLCPDLALSFAGRCDPTLTPEVLVTRGHIVSLHDRQAGVRLYARALLELPPPEEDVRRQLQVRYCIESIAQTNYELLGQILEKVPSGGVRAGILREYLRRLAENNVDRALRAAGAMQDPTDAAAAYSIILRTVVMRDPHFIFGLEESRAIAPDWLRSYAKPNDFAHAAVAIAQRGDVDTALRRLLWVDGPLLRADALAVVADACAGTDTQRAQSLLDAVLQLALIHDADGMTIASCANRIIALDPDKGRLSFQIALDEALDEVRRADDWSRFPGRHVRRRYSSILTAFASVDPHGALEAMNRQACLGSRHGVVNGPITPWEVASPMALAKIAPADPERILRLFRTADWRPARRSSAASSAISALRKDQPEAAERFLEFIDNEEERFGQHAMITTWKTYHAVGRGSHDVTQFEKLLDGASKGWQPHHGWMFAALACAAGRDREQALKMIQMLEDEEKRDTCLQRLTRSLSKTLEEAESLVRRIKAPSCRFCAWLYTGELRARQVPEWKLLVDWHSYE